MSIYETTDMYVCVNSGVRSLDVPLPLYGCAVSTGFLDLSCPETTHLYSNITWTQTKMHTHETSKNLIPE